MRGASRVVLPLTLLLTSGCFLDRSPLEPDPDAGPNAYTCHCQCDAPVGEATVSILASADDAEEMLSTGVVRLTSSDLELVDEMDRQLVGLRFPNLGIPPGAMIVSAHVQFTADENHDEPAELILRGELSTSAAAFVAVDGDLSRRAQTRTGVRWSPDEWDAPARGPAQRTPNLSAVIQELVDQGGWTTESPVALLISGEGRRVAVAWDLEPTQAAQLTITFQAPPVHHALDVCLPPSLNPTFRGTEATLAEVVEDCEGRVQNTLSGLSEACGYASACNCTVTATEAPTQWASVCNDPCVGEEVDATCSNFDPVHMVTTATHAAGDAPVCITSSPLSAGIYGRQSTCEVSGSGSISVEGETHSSPAAGTIEFRGGPCVGESCGVGMRYRVGLEPITVGDLFSSRTFEDLRGTGHSLPGLDAMLAPDGTGSFAPGSTVNSARGRSGSDAMAYSGSNGAPITISLLGGAAPSCSLQGALVGAVDPEVQRCEDAGPTANLFCSSDAECTDDPGCTDGVCNCIPVESSDVTLALEVAGALVNQPPSTVAGARQVVECNQGAGAPVTLQASTSDPDGNIVQVRWMEGSRVGPAVGHGATTQVIQALGTSTYVNRVTDAWGQSDEDTTVVEVVDTTPAEIDCNAPATITPPDPPMSFTASAVDACDAAVVTEIVSADCFRVNPAGKVIDTTHACRPEISGATLTVHRTVGVGNNIRWVVRATDASGNEQTRTCQIAVVRPGRP